MPQRPIALLAGILLVVTALPLQGVGAPAADEEPEYPVRVVSDNPVVGQDLDVHGDRVVWASPAEGAVEIRAANLATGNETVEAEIADPEGDVIVSSIAYDGRWIVWTDNRFGGFSVFAADTENETTARLGNPGNVEVDVSNGFAVWRNGANVTLTNLATGESDSYREQSTASPSISTPHVLWARTVGTNTTLYVDNLSAESVDAATTIDDGAIGRTAMSEERVAWVATYMELDGKEVKDILNMTVETTSLDDGVPDTTPEKVGSGKIGGVGTSDDWVAWKLGVEGRPGPFRMMHMPTEGIVPFKTLGTGGPALSEDHLVFVGADNATANRTGGHVYAVDLHPPDVQTSANQAPGGSWLAAAAAVGLVAFGARRSRSGADDQA